MPQDNRCYVFEIAGRPTSYIPGIGKQDQKYASTVVFDNTEDMEIFLLLRREEVLLEVSPVHSGLRGVAELSPENKAKVSQVLSLKKDRVPAVAGLESKF